MTADAFCPKCGTPRASTDRFCPKCGNDFGVPATPAWNPNPPPAAPAWNPPTASRPSAVPRLLLFGGIALVIILIYINRPATGGGGGGNGNDGGGGGVPQAPVTVSGGETSNSQPFTLEAGDYAVDWTATAEHDVGCYHSADLESTTENILEPLVSWDLDGVGPESGTNYIYGLDRGTYFVEAITGCASWSFTFRHQ